jgi:uncharacterized phage-associated protein
MARAPLDLRSASITPSPKILAVAKLVRDLDPDAYTMKLEKLLYYVQGWSLAWTGNPMFTEAPKNWPMGPVYPTVWFEDKNHTSSINDADLSELTDEDVDVIHAVVEKYRGISGGQMAALTHTEQPWVDSRRGLAPQEQGHDYISHDSMMRFFSAVSSENAPTIHRSTLGSWHVPPGDFMAREDRRWAGLLALLGA